MPVKQYALQQDIPVYQSPDLASFTVPAAPGGGAYNMAITASFGYLIPRHVIEHFGEYTLNMHPSLLPRYSHADGHCVTVL